MMVTKLIYIPEDPDDKISCNRVETALSETGVIIVYSEGTPIGSIYKDYRGEWVLDTIYLKESYLSLEEIIIEFQDVYSFFYQYYV